MSRGSVMDRGIAVLDEGHWLARAPVALPLIAEELATCPEPHRAQVPRWELDGERVEADNWYGMAEVRPDTSGALSADVAL